MNYETLRLKKKNTGLKKGACKKGYGVHRLQQAYVFNKPIDQAFENMLF